MKGTKKVELLVGDVIVYFVSHNRLSIKSLLVDYKLLGDDI